MIIQKIISKWENFTYTTRSKWIILHIKLINEKYKHTEETQNFSFNLKVKFLINYFEMLTYTAENYSLNRKWLLIYSFQKINLIGCNLHDIRRIHFNYMVWWLLTNVYPHLATINIGNIFITSKVFPFLVCN